MPPKPASNNTVSQAMVPMWDSSLPGRNPAPLPLNPRDPHSPLGPSNGLTYDSGGSSRETSPVRRGRVDSIGNLPLNLPTRPLPASPTRPLPALPSSVSSAHKRTNSAVTPSPGVREMQNLILSGGQKGERSPTRNATPTPRELFGSSTSFPSRKEREAALEREKEAFQREYSSDAFRKALDIDKAPSLPPLRSTPDTSTPPNALSHTRSLANLSDTPTKITVHDFHTLSSQLTGLTSIAANLQREMANLSRRSKDNATDLMSLKEAAKSRDEDIRRSLRDLQNGLTSFEATDRLLEAPARLSLLAPSHSSGSDSGRDSSYGDALIERKAAEASTAALERILREMPTKDDQDHALQILQEIQTNLNVQKSSPNGDGGKAQEKILSFLDDLREREASHGKELVRTGATGGLGDDARVITMLEDLRDEIHFERQGEQKILSILEEIKEAKLEPEARSDEKILSALEDLKGTEGRERIEKVATLLEDLKERETDERVVPLLEEILVKMDIMSEDFTKQIGSAQFGGGSKEGDSDEPPSNRGEIIRLVREIKQGMDIGNDVSQQVKQLLENWQEEWNAREGHLNASLKNLVKQMAVHSAEQRAAISRIPQVAVGGGLAAQLASQALTTTNQFPPDLDNEAAITALANIASTTTRTDITLSSINALIKVFQKENYSANTHSAEALGTMGRFLEELGHGIAKTNANSGDVRKILEVVRTGICSGNDKLAEFEGNALRQVEELGYMQKHLQKLITGDDSEALWKRDLGVKDDVEELGAYIDELLNKQLIAIRESQESILIAVEESNPAMLIAELKTTLGAMAQRSLEAFQRSENAVQQLKEESSNFSERHIAAIQNADPTEQISDLRAESKEISERIFSLCERIDAKCGDDEVKEILSNTKQELSELIESSTAALAGEVTGTKAAMAAFGKELPSKLEDIVVSAVAAGNTDEKTALALDQLKVEVSEMLSKAVALGEKPDDSWKILEPIAELRREITDMIDRSNTALAAPVHYPEAEEIKARIEMLARDLGLAMENTAATALQAAASSATAEDEVRATVTGLRNDIGEMGKSIAAAVASNSATAVEEGMKGAFEEMKDSVLVKVEQGLVSSDKAIVDIAHLSQQTKDAIELLKEEVMEMVNKSISMAVSTVKPDESSKNAQFLENLKSEITDVIITSVAAGTGSEELKELIEGIKSDMDMMNKQVAMPGSDSDANIKTILETMKADIEEIVSRTLASSAGNTAEDTKASIEELRSEIKEMMHRSSTVIAPAAAMSREPGIAADSLAQLEAAIANLKTDVNEMVEKSLAAAIANSTFDSEENVKDAIDELKRDVKDTLEKSMVPIPLQASDESARMVREAMGALRQEIVAIFDKKSEGDSEDKYEIVAKLDIIKAQFGDLLADSKNVEVKEAVEVLKIQVHGLLERSLESDNREIKEMLEGMKSQLVPPVTDTNVTEILADLKARIAAISVTAPVAVPAVPSIAVPSISVVDEGLQASIDEFKIQMQELLEKPTNNDDLKDAIENLQVKIAGIPDHPPANDTDLKETIESLKEQVESLAVAAKEGDLEKLTISLKCDIEEAVMKSTENISKFDDVLEIKLLVEEFRREVSDTMENHLEVMKGLNSGDAFESLKDEIKAVVDRALSIPASEPVFAAPVAPSDVIAAERTPESIPAPPSSVGDDDEKIEEVKDMIADLRKEVKHILENAGSAAPRRTVKDLDDPDLILDAQDLKEVVSDVNSAIGECRVEVAVVKVLVEEKSVETKEVVSSVVKATEAATAEIKGSIITVKALIDEIKTDSVADVKTAMHELHNEGQESMTSLTAATAAFRVEAQEGITELKTIYTGFREESKDSFEEVHKTVEGAQVEIKEAVVSIQGNLDAANADITEAVIDVRVAVNDASTATKDAIAVLSTNVEASQTIVKEEVAGVNKAVEEVGRASTTHHNQTQKQVEQVISLVDDLQNEWKGQQPTLFNALLEMKHLLLEAQKAAAKKPEIELPPPYDDSQTQDKLNQLIAGNNSTAKQLTQLDLLDSIKKQVETTSADITDFLVQQKDLLAADASAKLLAAHQAEVALERAIAERKLVAAATDALRDEQEKLQINVELLKEDAEELRARKLRLTGEVGGLETALNLRQEELLMIEARGEALERRMLDGVIEQSRLLLTKPSGKNARPPRLSKADKDAALRKVKHAPATANVKPATPSRRHLSLGQIGNESPPAPSKSGRQSLSGSTLGLGQKEPYSASLGLLNRSQSIKNSANFEAGRRKSSLGKTRLFSGGKENDEREPAVYEGDEDEEYAEEQLGVEGIDDEADFVNHEEADERSEDEGSVVRVEAEDDEHDGHDSLKRKTRSYPALGLDLSDGNSAAGSRNVSGVSSIA